jgi:predicted transcriptional regulator of viral defense system
MNLNAALARLVTIASQVVATNDAAAWWKLTPSTASQMLGRLARAGHIVRLKRGLWLIDKTAHPFALHRYLLDPAPSYISLQTALFHHGMIEQIPSRIHVVSTAKTKTIVTSVAEYMVHQITPDFCCGYELLHEAGAHMAIPEKALVDFCYFYPTRSRAFRSLPELELPRKFSRRRAMSFLELIGSPARRSIVNNLLQEIFRRV